MTVTDIIARLRNRIHDSPIPAEHLMDDAADEIERLRAALGEIAAREYGDSNTDWIAIDIARAALNQQITRDK